MPDAGRMGGAWLLRVGATVAIAAGSVSVCRVAPARGQADKGTTVRSVTPRAEAASTADFFVAPDGTPQGDGSLQKPWDLATALAQPDAVIPGSTLWLRGGTYPTGTNGLTSRLSGTPGAAIVVRSYPGELARLDGASTSSSPPSSPGFMLTVAGTNAEYRDLEVMSSANSAPNGGQFTRPEGLQIIAANNKFINLLVHDTGQGFGFWEGASDSEIAGCLIYYNGNSTLDHGIYTNNSTGTKTISDNILFRNYGLGVHAYTTNGRLVNFRLERNIAFDNGRLNPTGRRQPNFLLGSGQAAATSCSSSSQVAQNPKFLNNMSYHPSGQGGRALDLGYSTGSCNPTATGNYLAGDTTLTLGPAFGTITISDNTFLGAVAGFSSDAYPDNQYVSGSPADTQVFLLRNPYDARRANIVVYNWTNASAASVDVSSILEPGAAFEVRNAQNYLGAPVLSGTYTGGALSLPLTGLTPATPVGWANPGPTSPEFNVFVLLSPGPARAFVSPPPRGSQRQPRVVPVRPPAPH